MNYTEAIDYINSFIDYEKTADFSYADFKLERVEKLLERLGNPQQKFHSIQVAGTKGKGSTCAFIFSILKEAGYKAGLYTSPHLVSFRERIKVCIPTAMGIKERLISEDEFSKIMEKVCPEIEKLSGDASLGRFSFFDLVTVTAFLFFAQCGVNYAVLETGLGGRLDATNVVRAQVAAFTSISFDHTQILGDTLEKIAREKAGIIKDRSLVITAPQKPEAWKVLEKAGRQTESKFYEVGRDIVYEFAIHKSDGSIFDIEGIFKDHYRGLKIPLLGYHQVINAALAVGTVELLRLFDIVVSPLAIKSGLLNVKWPGRLQVVSQKPTIILDAAQNEASLSAIKKTIKDVFIYRKVIAIIGMCRDKDLKAFMEIIGSFAGEVILTKSKNPRAASVEDLQSALSGYGGKVEGVTDIKGAIKTARAAAASEDIILITGSCYLVGEAIEELGVKV